MSRKPASLCSPSNISSPRTTASGQAIQGRDREERRGEKRQRGMYATDFYEVRTVGKARIGQLDTLGPRYNPPLKHKQQHQPTVPLPEGYAPGPHAPGICSLRAAVGIRERVPTCPALLGLSFSLIGNPVTYNIKNSL